MWRPQDSAHSSAAAACNVEHYTALAGQDASHVVPFPEDRGFQQEGEHGKNDEYCGVGSGP